MEKKTKQSASIQTQNTLHNIRTSHTEPHGEVEGGRLIIYFKKKSAVALANAHSYHNEDSFRPGVIDPAANC